MNNYNHMIPMNNMPFGMMMDQNIGSREMQHQLQHPQHLHMQQQDASNNSAINMNMGLDMDEDGDSEDEVKRVNMLTSTFEEGRLSTSDAIQNFIMPEGYVADYVPNWTKNRSVIFDCGVKATHSNGKTVWFCLCSAQCQNKSSKGLGIAIKGAVTNCTNHLRDIHKIISPRSVKMIRRKPEGAGASAGEGEPSPTSGSTPSSNYKKRPHSVLASGAGQYADNSMNVNHAHSGQAYPMMNLPPQQQQHPHHQHQQHSQHQLQQHPATSSSSTVAHGLNESWMQHFAKNQNVKYQVLAAPGMEAMAMTIANLNPGRFMYHKTSWGKFPDGTDNIMLGGFQPVNHIAGENVLLLASFTNNSTTLTQFLVMVTLLQSFIESLTVVLPFYPVGTMERISREGQVATASTYAQMFSNLPNCGKPTRLVIYDLHTLQNRFYLHGNAIASLQTTVPLLIERMRTTHINCIAFPDDGSLKRFGYLFHNLGFEMVICGKTKDGDKPQVSIQDGQPFGKHVLVIDDLAQTGNTMFQAGMACKAAGAASVSAFVAHAVFPNSSWRSFLPDGALFGCFERFFVTNSMPSVTDLLPAHSVFEVLDLSRKIIDDLDRFT